MSAPLEAGRELDALVAEKVMGDVAWDAVIAGCSRGGRRCETMAEAEQYRESLRAHYTVGDIVLHDSVPHYSTDIAAAWLVVRSRPLGVWSWGISQCDDGQSFAEVSLGYRTSYSRAFPVWAPTPELAICRTALAACDSASSLEGR